MPAIREFIQVRWKTLMPFVALVISIAIERLTTVDAPAGWKAFALTALSSALVYLKRNTPAVAVAVPGDGVKPDMDRGEVGLRVLFLIVALILFLVAGAIGADWITSVYAVAFLAFGLAAWVLSELVP